MMNPSLRLTQRINHLLCDLAGEQLQREYVFSNLDHGDILYARMVLDRSMRSAGFSSTGIKPEPSDSDEARWSLTYKREVAPASAA